MLLNLTDISNEPLQSQIVRQIRAKILAGELAATDSLPSIRVLAKENQVSVITVQRAYEILLRQDLIHSRRGKGFFVSDLSASVKKTIAKQRLDESLETHLIAALAEGLSTKEIEQMVSMLLQRNGASQ